MHHHLDLVLDHWVLRAIIQRLGGLLFDVENLGDHSWHFLIIDFLLVLARVLVDVGQDGEPDWVHIDEQFGDEFIVHDSLGQELSSLICDYVMAQIDRSNLHVLLKEVHKRLYGLRCHSVPLQIDIDQF